MAHYAKVEDGIVTEVLVVDNSVTDGQTFLAEECGLGGTWIQTSYNTKGGIHYGPDGRPDNRAPLHYNFAGIGDLWDGVGFSEPQPFPSWTFDTKTYTWKSPVPRPKDSIQEIWNESTQSWETVTN